MFCLQSFARFLLQSHLHQRKWTLPGKNGGVDEFWWTQSRYQASPQFQILCLLHYYLGSVCRSAVWLLRSGHYAIFLKVLGAGFLGRAFLIINRVFILFLFLYFREYFYLSHLCQGCAAKFLASRLMCSSSWAAWNLAFYESHFPIPTLGVANPSPDCAIE